MAERPESIALVDVSYLFAKSWHGMGRDAHPGEAAQATLDAIAAVRESVEHTILCLDAPPYWRKELYPQYKAQRERPSDEEIAQKQWLLERIEKDGYSIARVKGFEADDLCATLAKHYGEWCRDVRIVSADKDCAQCVSTYIRMFVPAVGSRPEEVRGMKEVKEKFGVWPWHIPIYLALCGDKSDNIPGVPKVGGVTAAKMIAECCETADVITGLGNGIGKHAALGDKCPAVWRNLASVYQHLPLWLKLTTLRTDVPIDHEALLVRREVKPLVVDEDIERAAIAEETSDMTGEVTTDVGEVQDAEFDPISRAPEGYVLPPLETAAKAPAPQKTTALAKASATTEDLQPLDINSAYRLAKGLYDGKMYSKYPNEASVFTAILKARELGLKVTTALDCFSPIKGVLRPSADLIQALCERDPDCEYFKLIQSTPERAVYRIKRRSHDEPFPDFVYTMDDARTAGLASNDNYRKNPAAMLRARCKSNAGRTAFPGACCGMYCPEEMAD